MSNFECVTKTFLNDVIKIEKYRSLRTGLTIVVGDVPGPLVYGHFVLATEAHDDDGLPHTLEHLIFLGSEDYPYKGILDLAANKCLASGTNAWTDVDHTCYTLTTAGKDGFLTLLPIYLDHILYPTLTDSAFLTEVHHINGEGEDNGVVYCEMLGRENTAESLTLQELARAGYPSSGYSSNTGGLLKQLRTSTNNEKVRNYHAKFYRPENLTLIITGKVEVTEIFEALESFELKIMSKGIRESFIKPWRTPVAPLTESKDLEILFPSDNEDTGLVSIGYRGPKYGEGKPSQLVAISILLKYMTSTPISPLQKEFIEIDDPYASKIEYMVFDNLQSLLHLTFANVPINKINDILDKLNKFFQNFVKNENNIDMNRMKSIIEKKIQYCMSDLEVSPHAAIVDMLIGDAIYGENESDLFNRLNVKKDLETYLSKNAAFWINLIKEYFYEKFYVCIRAFPSKTEKGRLAAAEQHRLDEQRASLGQDGLKKKADELNNAKLLNERPAPDEILAKISVPSVDGIDFHYRKIFKSTDKLDTIPCVKFSDFPVYTEIYDIHTNFIYITITLNTADIEDDLRIYLPLFLQMIFELPVRENGTIIPYQEVVATLERNFIEIDMKMGFKFSTMFTCGTFSHTFNLTVYTEPDKYELCVDWLRKILFNIEFIEERIQNCSSKLYNTTSEIKRQGFLLAEKLLKSIYYKTNTNEFACSVMRQQKFLSGIQNSFDVNFDKIISDLSKIRNAITLPQNIGIHIAADLNKLQKLGINLSMPWRKYSKWDSICHDYQLKIIHDYELIDLNGVINNMNGTIVGIGCVESAYLYHACPAIDNFAHSDIPGLLLFLQYLTQLEGPLWRQIRGRGLAYSYKIKLRVNEGIMCFVLYRSTNIVAAYEETKKIIDAQLKTDSVFEINLMESARASLIFEIIRDERSINSIVNQCLLSSFEGLPLNYYKNLVKEIKNINETEMRKIAIKYLPRLFTEEAKTAIICHPDKINEIKTAFECFGRNLIVSESLDESILTK